MRRVFLIVLDSLGVGALPDAGDFGDEGAHTLDHLVAAAGGLDAPRLAALGLGCVEGVSAVPAAERPEGAFGRCAERSPGKDTSTGHWEMMGCELDRRFPVYPDGFSDELIAELVARTGVPGILCNAPASGTEVIARLGEEHVTSGRPIVYTSADSVLQVAAHEEHFGLERLLALCRTAREITRPMGLGRVIARPFVGSPGSFARTYNRVDYSLEPFAPTVLDRLKAGGAAVIGVGKIEDIFAGRGVTEAIHTTGNADGMRVTRELAGRVDTGLIFVNLIDFDMLYGHRRDPAGYRRALEEFDAQYTELEAQLNEDDLVILSADHGNDPTFTATTDHTREYVPVLVAGPRVRGGVDVGTRESFADIGATVEEALAGTSRGPGRSFLEEVIEA